MKLRTSSSGFERSALVSQQSFVLRLEVVLSKSSSTEPTLLSLQEMVANRFDRGHIQFLGPDEVLMDTFFSRFEALLSTTSEEGAGHG